MNYALDPTDNQLKILNEDHYYPFGLKHTNYNSNVKNFQEDPEFSTLRIIQVPSEGNTYRYKYQGQEWQDELGLGWYSYKWRNYDPAIARFMSIDPLTEEYSDYTPYQFSSNQPVHAPELEGLESSFDLNFERNKNRYESGEVSYEQNREMQRNGAIGAVVGAAVGFLTTLVSAEAAVTYIVEETIETAVEQVTGVPIITDPGDIVQQGVKKGVKEGIEQGGEKIVKKGVQEGGEKLSKVQKSKTTETIGDFTKKTEVRPGKGPGQSRAEYTTVKNKDGKTVKTYKDSYDRANNFQGRKPLRGGPEGRPQN